MRHLAGALEVRRQRRALLSLDDHMLKDIGLTRIDAWREGTRALFDVPSEIGAYNLGCSIQSSHGENHACNASITRRSTR
jgi:hypothetical protein